MNQVNILFVEDYDLVLFTVKQLLELEGWRVDICREGATALRKLESVGHHDIIILDVDIPGMRGLELLRRARALTHHRQTPIIIFTATDCEAEAHAAGANAFLKKPSGIRDIIQTIENLLDEQAVPVGIEQSRFIN